MKRKNLTLEENKETSQKSKPLLDDYDKYLFDDSSILSNIKMNKNSSNLEDNIISEGKHFFI